MRKRETIYKEGLLKELKRIPKSIWFPIQQVGLRGHPDIMGCVDGKFVALEVKKTAKEAESVNSGREKLQKYFIDKILESGGIAGFIHPDNEDQVISGLYKLAGVSDKEYFDKTV